MSQATNQQEFDRASQVLVGGVNSAVRAFRAVGGTPRFIQRAEGARMWDVEGKAYIDYVGSWGPAIVGHSHPEVLKAVQAAVADGLSFGAPNVRETELAQRICDMFPHVERVRFTSSGTESTMSALRLARGYTGRNRIIKFEGCYHGTADSLLVKAGSGALAFGNPSSAGVPEDVVKHTLIARYNDLDSVRRLFEQYPDDVACLIVEPIPGNMNLMVPQPGFLEGLRELCTQYGAVLIFDEVMSGFRVTLTGAQGWCGITPDLSTFGKVIGGGMPVGAVAGPARIMERFAPLGNVYQAGTLSGNPIAMAAGIATIDLISRPGFHDELNRRMTRLVEGLNAAAKKTGVAFCARALGGLGGMYFRATPPLYFEEATDQNLEQYKRFYHLMLEGGVYLPPSPVEAFKSVFESFGADLPAPTLFVMALSDYFVQNWYIIFGGIGLGIYFFLQAWKRSPKMQMFMDRLFLKLPIFGPVIRKATIARWLRTLSTMFAAGVPLVEALDSVGGAAGNIVYLQATKKIQQEVSTGTSLTVAMNNANVFPNMVLQMASIGEESGSLDSMLGKSADVYEREVDDAVESLSSLMEPLIMVVLGTLIGGLVVAMYLPIFKLGQVV